VAFAHDALEGAREVRLLPHLAGLVRNAVLGEGGDAGRVARHRPRDLSFEGARERLAQHEAVTREGYRGFDERGPVEAAVPAVRQGEPGDGSRNADRQVRVRLDLPGVGARR